MAICQCCRTRRRRRQERLCQLRVVGKEVESVETPGEYAMQAAVLLTATTAAPKWPSPLPLCLWASCGKLHHDRTAATWAS